MNESCRLTPVELYFCAKIMEARYLDYDYVKVMPDVQKQYLMREQEAMECLEEKGIIETDFEGVVSFDEEIRELLIPVFFGEKESRMDIEGQESRRFHIGQEKIIMTVLDEGIISLTEVTEKEIREMLKADKVEIHLADIRIGNKSRVFTSRDLEDENNRKMAVKLLKGGE